MSAAQNLTYAVVQVAHNFGAVAVVGGTLSGVVLNNPRARKNLAWLVLAGWAIQALSGAAFGATTYYFDNKLPDISGIAFAALLTKMGCAGGGGLLLAAYLYWGAAWSDRKKQKVWYTSSVLAITALTAAAFLRWYS